MASFLAKVKSAGLDRFVDEVKVNAVSAPAAGFRIVEVGGEALRGEDWTPGDIFKVRCHDDSLRSYTPFRFDPVEGSASFLAAGLSAGPGTTYLQTLEPGASFQYMGPKKSIDLGSLASAPVFIGDETIIGLCAAWNLEHPDNSCISVVEVADKTTAEAAATAIGAGALTFVEPAETVERAIAALRENTSSPVVISGRAQTIKSVRAAIKDAGLGERETKVKAYWDENRAGLD